MFEELYGPIGATLLAPLVMAIVQVIKAKLGAEDYRAILLSAGVSLGLIGVFSVLAGLKVWQDSGQTPTNLDIAILVFASFVWSLMGWGQSMGWYSVVKSR